MEGFTAVRRWEAGFCGGLSRVQSAIQPGRGDRFGSVRDDVLIVMHGDEVVIGRESWLRPAPPLAGGDRAVEKVAGPHHKFR